MLSHAFLFEFKRATEEKWSRQVIDPAIYGFQFQRGTRWNPGLSDDNIAEYESALRVRFPVDFRAFLRTMNGTDIPTLNVYGNCGEPHRTSVGVYSFPRDLEIVKKQVEAVRDSRNEIANVLKDQGFDLSAEADIVSIYGHRYVVCASDPNDRVVFSIVVNDADAIVYGRSLREYLEREFL